MLPKAYNDDDPIGVRHDALVDARIELEGALQQLRKTHVMLDVLADDTEGIWSPNQMAKIREMQGDISMLINAAEANLDEIDEEMRSIPGVPEYDG